MINRTKRFTKHFKKAVQNKKYHSIFNSKIHLNNHYGTRWEIIMECLEKRQPIPSYFVPHELHISQLQRKILANYFHIDQSEVHQLEFHLNGSTGDLLIIYAKKHNNVLFIDIGTHAQLFQ